MILLTLLGLLTGLLGTLVGAGGGFILLPTLIFLYPALDPETITGISMTVIFFNALSGTVAYARMKRIDYRSGAVFAAVALPGAYLGTVVVRQISRPVFNLLAGVVLLTLAVFLLYRTRAKAAPAPEHVTHVGNRQLAIGGSLSAGVGFISSLIGIGGGIIHVPALVYMLGFPVHAATATSHFVLVFTAATAVAGHLATGSLEPMWREIASLSVGVVVGAQIGARLSKKVKGVWIVRGLAGAMGLVSLRILLLAMT